MDPEKIECEICECELDEDDSQYLEGTGDVCSECHYENTWDCVICGEEKPKGKETPYILVNAELANGSCLPGIYRVLRRPFILSSLIGRCSLTTDYVAFVDKLPKPSREYEMSGHICKGCALPYAKKFRKDYRKAEPFKLWSKTRAQRQIEVTNKAIAEHPELLRDLETDYEREIEGLKKVYDIPEGATFYHEWLYREYKGVKLYHSYYPYPPAFGPDNEPGWLVLDPAPSSRDCRGKTTFDASGLPNFPMEGFLKLNDYSPERKRIRWETVAFAIDCGAITQEGVALRGDPIWKTCKSPSVPKPKKEPELVS